MARSGRIESWSTERNEDGSLLLRVEGALVVASHVATVLDLAAPMIQTNASDEISSFEWTLANELKREQSSTLDVLSEVLVVEAPNEMRSVIALDSYRIPDDERPVDEWELSKSGELVNSGKYRGSKSASKKLAKFLAHVVKSHSSLSDVDVVLSVPGHAQGLTSFGESLAAHVADLLGVGLIETATSELNRPQTKDLGHRADELLRSQFSIEASLVGKRALIVDDVIRSGASISAVAHAASMRDVASVDGIAGALTLRR